MVEFLGECSDFPNAFLTHIHPLLAVRLLAQVRQLASQIALGVGVDGDSS